MDDFDIEMGDAVDVPMEEPQVEDIALGDDQQEDGEIDEPVNGEAGDVETTRIVPNKVHIRGLDFLDENQLKSYIISHVGGKGADRIEWVNDTSANLVFSSDAAAQEALIQLAAVEIADATQLPPLEILPAKTIPDKPEAALQVRFAVESDRKERNAAQKSRFYLFHPEWDPETDEGRRRREGHNRRYRDRNDRGNNRRDGRGRYEDRFRDEEPETFDVNLYDDDAGALAKRVTPRPGDRDRDSRSASVHSGSDRHRPSTNRDKELFPNRKELFPNRRPRDSMRSDRGTYSRDRSRSPGRNDRDAMDDDLARDREAVRNNREKARSLKERISRVDAGDSRDSKAKELFPTKVAGDGRRAQMDQVPSDLLADRITDTKGTMSIRGSAHQSGGSGMLKIKGTSVKELFPNKFNGDSSNNSNNAGKELFADKISGGGRRRQKAEDLFY